MEKKHGLLLINLGTPSDTTHSAITQYLTEFLHDRHVVDLPLLIWYPILHGIVLPKRVPYIAKHYKKIWIDNQSPLLYYSQRLCDQLQNHLSKEVICELGMTYGKPSLSDALTKLCTCEKITVLPLFPQYSTTTTLASFDKLARAASTSKIQCQFNYINDYADNPSYIEALYRQIKHAFLQQGKPDVLLLSYHGIPVRYIKKRRDNYTERCEITTTLLIERLKASGINIPIKMAYQSKFGKGKWTTPNTSDMLAQLASEGIENVHVLCPGFAADCIETTYEIDEENREIFLNAGGKQFYYIPALNDSNLQINLILDLIKQSTLNTDQA